jgi:hypothetical protein
MRRLTGIAVAALMAIPATVAAQTGTDETKAIQKAADQWMAAYNAGDAAAVAKMYSEDARLSTFMGTADGRPTIEQYFKNEMGRFALLRYCGNFVQVAAPHSENAAGVRVHGSVRRASSIANRCLLKYVHIGGDGPLRSPLDSS